MKTKKKINWLQILADILKVAIGVLTGTQI